MGELVPGLDIGRHAAGVLSMVWPGVKKVALSVARQQRHEARKTTTSYSHAIGGGEVRPVQ